MANVTIQDINGGNAATALSGTDTIEGQVTAGGASKFFTLTTLRNWFLSLLGVWTKNQSVTPVPLTSASTVAVNASLSNNFKLVIETNATLSNPTNLTDGMVLNVAIKQDSTGGRTLAFDTKWIMLDGSTIAIASGANKFSILSGYYDATDDKIYFNLSVKA